MLHQHLPRAAYQSPVRRNNCLEPGEKLTDPAPAWLSSAEVFDLHSARARPRLRQGMLPSFIISFASVSVTYGRRRPSKRQKSAEEEDEWGDEGTRTMTDHERRPNIRIADLSLHQTPLPAS